MKRASCNVDLLHLAEPFDRWCAQHGRTRSAALRELVAKAIDGSSGETKAQSATPLPSSAHERGVTQYRHISVRLSERELAVLHRQAAAAGMSATRYIASMLIAAERGCNAIAGKDAVQALTESNHRLAWIGRNLSLAVRLHEGTAEQGVQSGGEAIEEAIRFLRQHLVHAAAVLADVERTRTLRRTGSGRDERFQEASGDAASAR